MLRNYLRSKCLILQKNYLKHLKIAIAKAACSMKWPERQDSKVQKYKELLITIDLHAIKVAEITIKAL